MEYPHKKILRLSEAGKRERKAAIERLLPGEEHSCRRELLRLLLKRLPGPKKQTKIIATIRRLAEEHEAEIGKFRWWDVQAGRMQALTAVLKRKGASFRVQFSWKNVRKGQTLDDVSRTSIATVVATPNDERDYLVDVEAGYYRDMLATFRDWLKKPLPSSTPAQ